MGIGPDIKEVLQEVGTPFTILRDGYLVTGEHLRYQPNRQVTKPFIREFFLECEVAYDTVSFVGDIIRIPTLNSSYIMMNKTGSEIEGEVFRYDAVLYKANVSGEILRPSDSGEIAATYSHDYHKKTDWVNIRSNAHALLTESMFGVDLDKREYGQISLSKNDLYVPHRYGIRVNDRYVATSGEYYRVTSVSLRRYDGVDVVEVEQDTRE